MKRHGFTIVELLVVITIMGILLTLGVVNLSNSQINGRDAERKTDIEIIASHLEVYYTSGADSSDSSGKYPSTSLIGSESTITSYLRDIDINSIKAPGIDSLELTFLAATNSDQTTTGVAPQPTIDQYIYQPINSEGSLCELQQECRKFNLYYRLESDNTIQIVESKNQ